MPVILDLHRSQHFLGNLRHHLFGHIHDLHVISVRHVKLELSKLRVVLEGDSFVPKITSDLINPVQSAHQQTFQVQFETYAQKEFLVQLVVIGGERFGCRTAVNRLQYWGLYFEEAFFVQEIA